ncbi:MAG: ankyrin repeat domain-containing protein [Planctomycetaceae bacterium]|nr:ankyrin repeat domain-containing protein [Planctomycetaceae bacterium]
MRRFLHFTTRQLALLAVAIGALLAILAPRLRDQYAQTRVENATRRLIEAAEAGDEVGVLAAIEGGARVDGGESGSPLAVAILGGNLHVVDLLLAAGAHLDWVVLASATPLEYAAQRNDVPLARRMLAADAKQGRALSICIEHGHIDVLKLFLPDAATHQWLTHAIDCQQPAESKLKVVRFLLEHGAPLSGRTIPSYTGAQAYTETPLDHALRNGDGAVCDLLREFGAPYTAREAVVLNRLEDVRKLVDENPELLKQRFKAYWYLDNGLDPTLLGLALKHGHRELSQYLLDAGAPLDMREWYNETVMTQAARGGDPELIRLLAGRGVSVNSENDYGSPLYTAIWREHPAAVTVLLELGADATRPGLLHRAYKQPQVIQQLLAAGADPLSTNHEGQTALEHARKLGQSDVVVQLEKAARDRGGPAPPPAAK